MSAVAAHELPLLDFGLQEQGVKVAQRLLVTRFGDFEPRIWTLDRFGGRLSGRENGFGLHLRDLKTELDKDDQSMVDLENRCRMLMWEGCFSSSLLQMRLDQNAHLISSDLDGVPIDSWQNIDEELGVIRDIALFELGVLIVKREAEGRRFAGFHSAGQKRGR